MRKIKLASILLGAIMVLSLPITTFAKTSNNTTESKTTSIKTITANSQTKTIELKEGQILKIPIAKLQDNSSIHTDAVFPGNAGTVELWVSGSRIYYKVSMKVPVTSFSGIITVTNLSTGLSGGSSLIGGFSGYCSYNRHVGNKYNAHFTGNAYLGPVSVAHSGPWTITWTA